MKNTILKTVVLLALVGVGITLSASSYTYNTRSLIGVEGSYNTFDIENVTLVKRETKKFTGVGLKIGAQTDNYRLFLSARNNFISGYDYAYSLGAEAQYLMNFSSFMNMFIGGSGGYTNLRFVDSSNASRELVSPYLGGDIGFNIHLGESVDLELGARTIKLLNPSHTQNNITYNIANTTSGYMSIIFKYSMDKY